MIELILKHQILIDQICIYLTPIDIKTLIQTTNIYRLSVNYLITDPDKQLTSVKELTPEICNWLDQIKRYGSREILMDSSLFNNYELFKFLIELGVNPRIPDDRGDYIWILAFKQGNFRILRYLIKNNVIGDQEIKNMFNIPKYYLVRNWIKQKIIVYYLKKS